MRWQDFKILMFVICTRLASFVYYICCKTCWYKSKNVSSKLCGFSQWTLSILEPRRKSPKFGWNQDIPCGDCEKEYLDQTKHQFCTRLKEHQRVVSNFNSSKPALAELHVSKTSHNIASVDSRNITTNNRYGQRLCLEAWHINASPCALNKNNESYYIAIVKFLLFMCFIGGEPITWECRN